ncbi:coiled-coil domain-containing protein 40 isoform X2 [Belonocnema kinseyi]|uniref:coiled-coil domain-containing protein 40 isoform X2 n=1 Tax=Belonocnema kinseyi TaxID=2817044 RepID=UPI00143D5B6F|nr:coiled-coil domain-containing protein 40 isoform X2 [Belonocnema kinseyi]
MDEVRMDSMESPIEEYEYYSKIIEKSPTIPNEESRPKFNKQLWMREQNQDQFKILDPNDPLMRTFQDALQAHLTRISNTLSDEIFDTEAEIKVVSKTCEVEDKKLYNAQSEIARQEKALENCQSMIDKLKSLYEDNDQQVKDLKELQKRLFKQLQDEKSKEIKLIQNLSSIAKLEKTFIEWETEINKDLLVSQRVSEKDAAIRRELIQQKQRRDYVLFKLMNEVHKIEEEIRYLDEQLQLKDKEKIVVAQTIADANADLEALQRDHKSLLSTWNSVLNCISQRDFIHDQLSSERRKIQESFQNLQTQIDKMKKDSNNEMENNEKLTSIHLRIEEDMKCIMKVISGERNKIANLEFQFAKIKRLVEQGHKELENSVLYYQQYENEEKIVDKEFGKFASQKINLEDEVLSNLDDKVTHDKVVRNLNKLLCEAKDLNQEQELLLVQAENVYGKNVFEIERVSSSLEKKKSDLADIIKRNMEKEKEIDHMQAEISRCDTLIEKKQRQVISLNMKIDEIISITGEESNPLDFKIGVLERSIEEIEIKNQKLKQLWLFQEGNIVTLSQEINSQTQELNLISKQNNVMEQKNLKIEFDMDKQGKEKANIERTINLFQQRLTQINSRLATQRGLKDELESKNYTTKSEYIKSLQDEELNLIKLQSQIKYLINEKAVLKDQLLTLQREGLSWERKVQLAFETSKSFKEERSAGGDVAIMKSEIHKMEMRLSHLKKVQEKLIHDMEFCISRRDVIMDGALAKEMKNPKGVHNQRVILHKRLDDRKVKIKQIAKETKQYDKNIVTLEIELKKALEKLNEGQRILRENEDAIPDTEKQIMEAELLKYHFENSAKQRCVRKS